MPSWPLHRLTMNVLSRAGALEDLWEKIRADPKFDHLRTDGIRLVPGIGTLSPQYFVVGEAPGAQENLHGRPFCGPSGRVLTQLMDLAGLHIKDEQANTWITNVVKYRPPGNRTPTWDEVAAAQPYLRKEWTILGKPRVIVTVGVTAYYAMGAPLPGGLSNNAGKPIELPGDRWLWAMFHPAYGLRQQKMRPVMESHWEALGKWIKEGL